MNIDLFDFFSDLVLKLGNTIKATDNFVAVFEGDLRYGRSNETQFVAVVELLRVSVLLDIAPREFNPPDYVTLKAQVINMSSSSPLANAIVRFYKVFANNSTSFIDSRLTNGSGWAVLSYRYDLDDGLYAFNVTVDNAEILAVSYVDLTVTARTRLYFSVEKQDTSTVHRIGGRLYCYGVDTSNKPFKILVNGTLRDIVYTDANGVFNIELDLQPLNGSAATYRLEAIFEGETPQNVIGYYAC